jgi:hypothetical protein
MSGGGKGPSSSGNITQTTSNKTADTLLPYQQGGWDAARYTFDNNPTPPAIAEGYDKQYDIAKNYSADLTGAATGSLKDTLNGGMGISNSPSYGTLYGLSTGDSMPQLGLKTTGNSLFNLASADNPAGDLSASTLSKEAGGDYLNANPYLDKMYDSAARGVTRAYQTATAPQTDSTYELSGRYGSGAHGSAISQNQQDLGVSLDDLASSIYGKNYSNERTLQNTAATSLGTLGQAQQRLQGSLLDAAGTQYKNAADTQGSAATNLQTGFNAANANENTALGYYPATQKETFYPATQMTAAGQGLQKLPYGNVSDYLSLLPNSTSSSGSTTTPVLGPSALSSATGLLGAAGGASSLGKGLGDLFGGGGGWPAVVGLGGL